MYALKVEKSEAQKEIDRLKSKELYDYSRKVTRNKDWVFLPVVKKIPGSIEKDLPERDRTPSLKEEFGIGSFDIVGDLGILWIPEEKWEERDDIAKHLMELYPRLKAVHARSGAIGGKFRLPDLQLLSGSGTETVHTENGMTFKLDVAKAYFSPRQATERMELMDFIRPGDVVSVFFAGIGPIPVYASRLSKAEKIFAVEMNPDACRYMKENIRINKCRNVEVLCGDVREEYEKLPPSDLVVMPLPKNSLDFIDEAHSVLKEGGRLIVYVASTEEELQKKLEGLKKKFKIDRIRQELEIAPKEFRFVVHAVK